MINICCFLHYYHLDKSIKFDSNSNTTLDSNMDVCGPTSKGRCKANNEADTMTQVFYFYSYGTAAWLSTLHAFF